MDSFYGHAYNYKVIYVFTIKDSAHSGLLKIGDATLETEISIDKLSPNCRELNQAALKRIKAYTNTAGITPELLHTELAIRQEGKVLKAFRDYQVHEVLKNSNYKKETIGNTTGKEWYRIDLETAKKAIEAVKKCYCNLSNSGKVIISPIIFRPEQEECIEKVVNHFKNHNRFLINAKMRYGKTFVSLEIIKRITTFKKTIILTHRPVVDAGWYDDFTKIFTNNNYIYGSKQTGYSIDDLLKQDKPFIYFASIQDLRGSFKVGGKFKKNDAIFNTIWDCVIVDEAHEGTTTALGEDTVKAVVKPSKKKTKFLALSGTPFNILGSYDEHSIYTWDYVMEQQAKNDWDKMHFGDHNPYDELPTLKMRLYSLKDILANTSYAVTDKAFNFAEFFRTWTGDIKVDHTEIPTTAKVGDFVHEGDIKSFLNLLTTASPNSYYPYSCDEYRNLFKHSLWMLPGVKEAKALKKLMEQHPVFGLNSFNIVNVAGKGDEEGNDALATVKNAIKSAGDDYTITLSCGKLTTGVTVKEWTAVFMLAGSYSTSAANYLQTIFRVQSPCNSNGKVKENAYVFDFAPDRTLKMVASAVKVSSKAGKTKIGDIHALGQFMNYTSIIAVDGSKMIEYNPQTLLQRVKRMYAERVVTKGFDDNSLYNDELLNLNEVDVKKFEDLQKIIGKNNALPKTDSIDLNSQGMNNEERERLEKKKRSKKPLTAEEKKRLEELKKIKENRLKAISTLRAISIRMPLLIFGADIPYDEEITLEKFVDIVDGQSWNEFMPKGITKRVFKEFKKYYDAEVFIAAGRRIRNIAREADKLEPTERVKEIANLFSFFKNPDKETVLTPWRIVNLHMSDTIGGWDFWNETHTELLDTPRYVKHENITANIFENPETKILEINSKTGLYPLYATYSCYRNKCEDYTPDQLTHKKKIALWNETLKSCIFVVCKTPMAKAITKRTLLGYNKEVINAHYFNDLLNNIEHKPQQIVKKLNKGNYWKVGYTTMQFNAIIGNPPYQSETGGAGRQAKPVYNHFIDCAKMMEPGYISMIMPSRWFAGGMNLDDFRDNMVNDERISKIVDYTNAKECFPQISISGGICYLLWDKLHQGNCDFINIKNGNKTQISRKLNEFKILVRYNSAISILHKILDKPDNKFRCFDEIISPLMPFGLPTNYRGDITPSADKNIALYASDCLTYINESEIAKGHEYLNKYNIMMSKMSAEHAGEPDRDGKFKVFTNTMRVLKPNEACTHSYFLIGNTPNKEEAENIKAYLETKFVRFLVLMALSAVNLSKFVFIFVPLLDFSKQWDDESLFAFYNFDENEINFINSMVKPM